MNACVEGARVARLDGVVRPDRHDREDRLPGNPRPSAEAEQSEVPGSVLGEDSSGTCCRSRRSRPGSGAPGRRSLREARRSRQPRLALRCRAGNTPARSARSPRHLARREDSGFR